MKEHIVGLVILITMAVDALPFLSVDRGNLVIENLIFFKRRYVTLRDRHIAPRHVCRFDKTIGDVFIYRLFGYLYLKRFERSPPAVILAPYLNLHGLALGGC